MTLLEKLRQFLWPEPEPPAVRVRRVRADWLDIGRLMGVPDDGDE